VTDLTIPDEAVEAAASTYFETDAGANWARMDESAPRLTDRFRRYMHRALTAALPILHPATHNTVEALEALPIGSVIRGNDADGPVAERETSDEWAIWDGSYTTPQLVGLERRYGITEWTVLWPLGGAS